MIRFVLKLIGLAVSISMYVLTGCSGDSTPSGNRVSYYSLDANATGVIETRNNIVNMTVVSKDANDLKAEYRAGFVQGKLQGKTIISARDNNWDNAYLTDPGHTFPKQPGPTQAELDKAATILNGNYNGFIIHLKNSATDVDVAYKLKRLLFRMLGIYHGATLQQPASLDFSGNWLPDSNYFSNAELSLGYETPSLTFMDIYFLNAYNDLMDVISFSPELTPDGVRPGDHPDKCSAFLKRTSNDIILSHNSWMGFLSQSLTQTLAVNNDLVTMNSSTPGQIGSNTDFGYNNKGIMFNETTHRVSRNHSKPNGLWIFWRATLAEQFSTSITDFFNYISLDNTGTYLNGYMLIDANNNETGLVEMSYRCFVYYRSTGGAYTVTTKSLDSAACSADYDPEMVTPEYLMGINYPASYQVATDLLSTDNRPARRRQFKQLLPGVIDLETAKSVITYTDPANPLSIFGRWDLGYGETSYPKTIPDGSVDSKAASVSMARSFMGLAGTLDFNSTNTGIWMLYGTAPVNGTPFIWSLSSWKWQKLRDVPDRLDGSFTLMPLYLR
ncbi:hypothetical protein FY034_07990 [Trichlorobacter lovleyi]|uniref:hypothetical protein n=1 Tax=Trichlorobacter lovleyi TaxID=313985 RepID=UPI00224025A6|nr:hypothetical protein [Trichlorobacter lovleyi]QOX78874.1 hypothetical protein FY034_07990 [Trichlorobacter lovleyi]